jgi:hypothetical protein
VQHKLISKEQVMTTFTVELLQKTLPSNLRTSATQGLVDMLNNVSNNQQEAELIRENFLGYTAVLSEGKYKTEDYLNAVKYVSFKLMKCSNEEAYVKTFPQRYQRMVKDGVKPKDIGAYVYAYSKNKLVNRIMEQTMVPSWVLNQDIFQEAINTQASLMRDPDVSPKVRSDAANSLLTHLAKPKEAGPLINLDMRDTSGMKEMKELLVRMAQQQQGLIKDGVTAKDIAGAVIIDVEATDGID